MLQEYSNFARPDLNGRKMPSFYSLSPEQRHAIVTKAIAERRTLMERWQSISGAEASAWVPRVKLAGSWLTGFDTVADIGAAAHTLKRFLPKSSRYVPVDCIRVDLAIQTNPDLSDFEKQDRLEKMSSTDWSSVIVADLNAVPLPQLGAQAAGALGFIEYIFDPAAIIVQMRQQFRRLVISYGVLKKGSTIEERERQGWVNHLTLTEFEHMLSAAGWNISRRERLSGRQYIWQLD